MKAIKRRLFFVLSIILALSMIMITTTVRSYHQNRMRIGIGGKNTTEGHLLSEIMAQLIENRTTLEVKRQFHLDGTFIAFHALRTKAIDIYVEYTGSALVALLKTSPFEVAAERQFDFVKEAFEKRFQLTWLPPLGFSCGHVLLTHQDFVKKTGITKLSQLQKLQKRGEKCRIALDGEFASRPELNFLEKRYDLSFKGRKLLDHTLLFLGLEKGLFDVINAYETEGWTQDPHVRMLEDDLQALPAYAAAPVVRLETLQKHPKLKKILSLLTGKITKEEIKSMNYRVEKKQESVHDVAKQFLIKEKLI